MKLCCVSLYTRRIIKLSFLLFLPPSLPYNTIQYNTIQYNTTQHNTIQYNTTQHNTTQHNTTQHNTTQHNAIQYNTIQYNTTQHNTIQYNIYFAIYTTFTAQDGKNEENQGKKINGLPSFLPSFMHDVLKRKEIQLFRNILCLIHL